MQQYLVEAVTAYQAGDFDRALKLLSRMPDGAMPLQALALKANIFARRGEARAAGETFLRAARMPGADGRFSCGLRGACWIRQAKQGCLPKPASKSSIP